MRALALARKSIYRHRPVSLRRLRYAREKSSGADKPDLEALTKTVNQLHAEDKSKLLRALLPDFDKSFKFEEIDTNKDSVITREEFAHWRKKVAGGSISALNKGTEKITWKQLRLLAIVSAVPMVGFGFVDNVIMICCGDYIDATLGVRLGISAMAAAGLGNAVSDVAGVFLGDSIERLASKLGLRAPKLSREQMATATVARVRSAANAIGILVGCLLGMLPLLFLSNDEKKAATVFTISDADKSGDLDIQEFLNAASRFGVYLTPDQASKVMRGVQRNDGWDDVLAKVIDSHSLTDLNKETIRSAWEKFDIDNSGFISKENLLSLGPELGLRPEEIDHMLGDHVPAGGITYPEFLHLVEKRTKLSQRQFLEMIGMLVANRKGNRDE